MKITDLEILERQGEDWLPKYMGMAYIDYARAETYYYLIPFNLLIRWVRQFWYFASYPKHSQPTWEDKIYKMGFLKGHATGRMAHNATNQDEYFEKIMKEIKNEQTNPREKS